MNIYIYKKKLFKAENIHFNKWIRLLTFHKDSKWDVIIDSLNEDLKSSSR